jgi:predicted ABC-type ATPase
VKDTLELHLNARGELSLERTLLHGAILSELLKGRPRHERPDVAFMAGGPASGKSTLAQSLGLTTGAVRIDVDEVRQRLPEYGVWRQEGREDAADLTHREASQIAKLALGTALGLGMQIVLDSVGGDDDGSFSTKIRSTLTRGARVRVCYATVPVELALAREQERFEATGRRVPKDLLRAKHAEVSRGLDNIARLAVERIEIFDMTGPEPRLLARGPGGQGRMGLEAVDPDGYAAFLAKGLA